MSDTPNLSPQIVQLCPHYLGTVEDLGQELNENPGQKINPLPQTNLHFYSGNQNRKLHSKNYKIIVAG